MAVANIKTRSGDISIWDSQSKGPVVLMIHGNSACKEVFKNQFNSLGKEYRIIAIDLPGHGKSADANDPKATYNLNGYADTVIEVLENLGIERATFVGWSMGGHVAIKLLNWKGTDGILITGTPPIPLSREGFDKGFLKTCKCLHLLSQIKFTREEGETFIQQGGFDPKSKSDSFLLDATLRTDGQARAHLIASMANGEDQKAMVETTNKPVAIVHGQNDTGISLEYMETEIDKKALWERKIHVLDGGHAIFWEQPNAFNHILRRFLVDVEKQKAAQYKMRHAIVNSFGLLALAGLALSFFRSKS